MYTQNFEAVFHVNDLSLAHERKITSTGTGIINSTGNCRKPSSFLNSKHTVVKNVSVNCTDVTRQRQHSHRLCITDVVTKVHYLVNIGTGVGVLNDDSNDRLHERVFNVHAANVKPRVTYGKRNDYLNMGLHTLTRWVLAVADVSVLIIVIDLIQPHNLITDSRKQKLVAGNVELYVWVTFFLVVDCA